MGAFIGRRKELSTRLKPDSFHSSEFKSKVNGPVALRPGAVPDIRRNSKQLSGRQFHGPIFQINTQNAFYHQEGFIAIGMIVPIKGFCHYTEPYNMVIYQRNRNIFIALDFLGFLLHINYSKRGFHKLILLYEHFKKQISPTTESLKQDYRLQQKAFR